MARLNWQNVTPVNPDTQLLRNSQVALAEALSSLTGGFNTFAQSQKDANTNNLLTQIMGIDNTANMPTAQADIQQQLAMLGNGVDSTKVATSLDARTDVLNQRQTAEYALQKLADEQHNNTLMPGILSSLAKGDKEGFNKGISEYRGDPSNIFTMLFGRQDRADDVNYRKENQTIQQNQFKDELDLKREGLGIQKLATVGQLASQLSPDDGGTKTSITIDENGQEVVTETTKPSRMGIFGALLGKVQSAESNGRHYDKNGNLLRSPAGALGTMQIMPQTAAKPGYGMQPINLHTTTPEQQQQWAMQYLDNFSQYHKYDLPQAVAGYNAGPGRVKQAIDKANKSGGNWYDYLPSETKEYVPKILGNNWRSMNGKTPRQVYGNGGNQQQAAAQPVSTPAKQKDNSAITFKDAKIYYNAKADYQSLLDSIKPTEQKSATSQSVLGGNGKEIVSVAQWLSEKRTDPANANKFPGVLGSFLGRYGINDAADIYKVASRNKNFNALKSEKQKVAALNYLFTENQRNEIPIIGKNMSDDAIQKTLDNVISDFAKAQKSDYQSSKNDALRTAAVRLQKEAREKEGKNLTLQQAMNLLEPRKKQK